MNPVIFKQISVQELALDPSEVARRLHTVRGYTDETVEACRAQLDAVIDARFSAVRVAVSYPHTDAVDLGFGAIPTHALYRNLNGVGEAFVFAATVGHGVDRLLARLSLTSPAEHFITDALASAYAEAVCEYADAYLRDGLCCGVRFSPGYGDLPLSVQPNILNMVEAGRLLGITLGKTLLMSPMKSVTAVLGIKV